MKAREREKQSKAFEGNENEEMKVMNKSIILIMSTSLLA